MKINLFKTQPHPCSYIDGEEASTVFVDPDLIVDPALYSSLSRKGFRRSGAHLYRPHCRACNQCIPTRVPVNDFRRNRSQKRCWQRNRDLVVEVIDDIDSDELFELYRRYIETRHADGDMYPADRAQYREFLASEWPGTRYARFTVEGKTLGIAVFDRLDDGLSAIYTFFDPDCSDRGLGTYAVLWLIEQARSEDRNYLYLGYWIKACDKMRYKSRFRPLELLNNERWIRAN